MSRARTSCVLTVPVAVESLLLCVEPGLLPRVGVEEFPTCCPGTSNTSPHRGSLSKEKTRLPNQRSPDQKQTKAGGWERAS